MATQGRPHPGAPECGMFPPPPSFGSLGGPLNPEPASLAAWVPEPACSGRTCSESHGLGRSVGAGEQAASAGRGPTGGGGRWQGSAARVPGDETGIRSRSRQPCASAPHPYKRLVDPSFGSTKTDVLISTNAACGPGRLRGGALSLLSRASVSKCFSAVGSTGAKCLRTEECELRKLKVDEAGGRGDVPPTSLRGRTRRTGF